MHYKGVFVVISKKSIINLILIQMPKMMIILKSLAFEINLKVIVKGAYPTNKNLPSLITLGIICLKLPARRKIKLIRIHKRKRRNDLIHKRRRKKIILVKKTNKHQSLIRNEFRKTSINLRNMM